MSQDGDNGKDTLLLEDETIRHGFVIFPKSLIYARNLSAEAKMLYGVLVGYAFEKDHCFPGLDRLCEDMGLTANTLRLRMNELKAAAILKVKRRGQGKTNVYIIADLRNAKFEYQKSSASRNAIPKHLETQNLRTKNRIEEVESVEEVEEEKDSNPPDSTNFDEVFEVMRHHMKWFGGEFSDEATPEQSAGRAFKLWRKSGLDVEEFIDIMQEARKKTKVYTGSIKKKSSKATGTFTKNKMPYFFSVLEDLLGLKK